MTQLDNLTMKEVTEHLTDRIATDFDVTKKDARKLLTNALSYNIVVEEIENQISYLLGED
ncbi:MAG: hypothetical protein LIO94_02315 [Clostridiales bacterium]|nr:hypothetical protein [Clostridiales bacterium]